MTARAQRLPRLRRFLRHLRVEDLALFAWLVLRPVLLPDAPRASATNGYDPIGGLFDLVALCLAAACVAAHRADSSHSGLVENQTVAWAVGPLFGAVAFALDDASRRLGLADAAGPLPLVLPLVAAVGARLTLPPTTAVQRRALVTPFVLATSGFFSQILAGFTDLFNLRALLTALRDGTSLAEALFVLGFALLGTLIFYLMLVFAPRQIAQREGTPRTWAIRFAVFVAGLTLGTTLAAMVHGR